MASLEIMMASLANNTSQQYSVAYKKWWQFCLKNDIDPYINNLPTILTFLTEQFHNNAAYGTLNSYRSALSLLFGDDLGSHEQIKRLLKGIYKLRPNVPKYTSTWNPQTVLQHIAHWGHNKDLSLQKLTHKLVTLLALCTAQRAQTLASIKIKNINIDPSGVRILISDIIKTSAAGRDQPILFLPYFEGHIDICPATALKDYLSVTKDLRPNSVENLLLTYKRPHKAVCTQTISRWIKVVLADSGVDVSAFGAHSTRHAASSAARARGVSLDVIMRTVGWSQSSQTFAKFYNRPVSDDACFARSVFLDD